MELDDNIFDQNKLMSYFQNTVYLLHYPNGNKVEYSTGKIKSIALDNYEIGHFCESEEGSSGAPIINLANFKVIGVHKGSKDNKNFNVGTFLKGPIEKFYKKYKEKLRPELNYFPKINVYQMQVIINQMKNSVCKIFDKNLSGTGFLCYIPFPSIINKFPILLTANHILSEKYIYNGSKINFSFGDSNYINTIIIDKNRIVFSNKALDFTIIGIKPSDKIKSEYFLQFDENILNKDNFSSYFNYSAIYTMGYERNKNISYSIGMIKENKADGKFYYLSHTDEGSSGSPIMNLNNFKVLGIHQGRIKNQPYKIGISLKNIVESTLNKYYH